MNLILTQKDIDDLADGFTVRKLLEDKIVEIQMEEQDG